MVDVEIALFEFCHDTVRGVEYFIVWLSSVLICADLFDGGDVVVGQRGRVRLVAVLAGNAPQYGTSLFGIFIVLVEVCAPI